MKSKRLLSLLPALLLLMSALFGLSSCTNTPNKPPLPPSPPAQTSEQPKEEESMISVKERELENYKVVYLSDTHLYDWDTLYFTSSAQRIAFGVQGILKEHREKGKVDLVVITGDVVNNWAYEYPAGEFVPNTEKKYQMISFGVWDDFVLDGVTYSSRYKGVTYPEGSSGTKNDALGVLRILSFRELIAPLEEAGIPILYVAGNHECYEDSIWEMGFEMNKTDGYLGGLLQYEEDEDGNLLVPSYEIVDNEFSFYTATITPYDDDYEYYKLGYGTEYAYAMSRSTAYTVLNNFPHVGEGNGFGENTSSGRAWRPVPTPVETLNAMQNLVLPYDEVYFVCHCAYDLGSECLAGLKKWKEEVPGQLVAILDGHTHLETVNENFNSTGITRLTCGYLGLPMLDHQDKFQQEPFSYRIVEKTEAGIESCIALFERDYPEYTYPASSKATIPAFNQPYTRRGKVKLR